MVENARWRAVTLYGVEHSPWVQGIRLALAHHGISTKLTSVPMGLPWLLTMGPVFPVLRAADGHIVNDSFAMYAALEGGGFALGLDRFTESERLTEQAALERMFRAYAGGRCVPGKRWAFIHGWSTMRETPVRLSGVVWRAWLTHYFWVLIQLGNRMQRARGRSAYDLSFMEEQLTQWDVRLTRTRWVTGPEVGFLDFALLGHVQCMTTGLTDELLPMLRSKTHLVRWLQDMDDLLPDYTPRYARRVWMETFEPQRSGRGERLVFWGSWVLMLMLWPASLALLMVCLWRRASNPAHTGAVSRRLRRTGGADGQG